MKALRRAKAMVPRRYRYAARGAVLAAVGPLFAGRRVACPCCSRRARRWVALGPYLLCPWCSSAKRDRLLMLYLRNETGFLSDRLRVVHFAAEYCLMRRFRRLPNLDYMPADLDPPVGAAKLDLTDIALEADSVDAVICSHVLEHVEDDRRAMTELLRILRPGGEAYIMVPWDPARERTFEDPTIRTPGEREAAFGQDDHVRLYGRDLPERLRGAGFDVNAVHYGASLGPQAVERHGLPAGDIIWVCSAT